MITTTLDVCVREALMEDGLSLHYYLKYLNFAVSAFEEYNFDFEFNVKEVAVEPNEFNEVSLPNDCLKMIRISQAYNDRILSIDEDPMLNGAIKTDEDDNQVAWTQADVPDFAIYAYEDNINALGEYMGRQFGYVGYRKKAYRYIPERDVIQLSIDVTESTLYLMYLSDGFSTSSANTIHPLAKRMVKEYIHWRANEFRVIENGISATRQHREQFYNEKRLLRERLSNITVESLFTTGRMAHHSGLKE